MTAPTTQTLPDAAQLKIGPLIAKELAVGPHQVAAAVALLDEGATVPFIARYRKEATGNGHIINMGSMASWVATPTYSIYAASKFALRGFSEALRREVGIYNVKVSAIYPGGVATEFGEHLAYQRKTGFTTPKGLRLPPEGVAETVWKVAQHPRRGVMIPGIMRLSAWMNFLFPGLVDRTLENRFTKPERMD